MISPFFLDAPKLLLKFKDRRGLWDNDPGLKQLRFCQMLYRQFQWQIEQILQTTSQI